MQIRVKLGIDLDQPLTKYFKYLFSKATAQGDQCLASFAESQQ